MLLERQTYLFAALNADLPRSLDADLCAFAFPSQYFHYGFVANFEFRSDFERKNKHHCRPFRMM